jgi:O-Antigen ligase
MKSRAQLILPIMAAVALLSLFVLAERMPGLFADTDLLGGILALQVACIGLSHFEEIFFPLMMVTFLIAGSFLPFSGPATSLRWLFLTVGALGGFVIWIKRPGARHFGPFHLMALFCVTSALVSAAVSEVPKTALLKAASLFLLFLYASAGARLTIAERGEQFIAGLVSACEALVYFSAVCYFVLRFSVFGNPNALGAIIGIIAVPVLLWGASIAETRGLRQRRLFALILCGGLLYLSDARASILGAAVVFLLFSVALRNQRLLFRCAFIGAFFFSVMAVVSPSHLEDAVSSAAGRIIYKERDATTGIFGSRYFPWLETLSVVKRHPWLGSGFGTSEMGGRRPAFAPSSVYTTEGTNREHGSSYLALAEYLGVLGAIPFVILLLMLIRALVRVFLYARATANFYQPSVPFALVVVAGLVHACFEDWLFAVGSYLCVFFWVSAFLLIDVVPETAPKIPATPLRRRSPGLALPAPVPR